MPHFLIIPVRVLRGPLPLQQVIDAREAALEAVRRGARCIPVKYLGALDSTLLAQAGLSPQAIADLDHQLRGLGQVPSAGTGPAGRFGTREGRVRRKGHRLCVGPSRRSPSTRLLSLWGELQCRTSVASQTH